ncbi:MAG: hypothetical protein COV52_10030 [Gammaproteobacteria bacterium CG11_big_fil_rev_8_21_14_0_20_46_22]|nr:MAG: hypothetical protein COW05_05195 [Gammaproteobacteria bacterium CG12_big_fil_rev_8_21_14_0_65_46_12]PIR10159.1 MAG: hypothetical protein COV52_10030 [Gammaproteobacteria bacterium CG11_big_fil_rev_8_21_14_0_20_46_22]
MGQRRKITQKAFLALYINSLDDPLYRPLVNGSRHFRLDRLLEDQGYLPSLAGLSARNLNFRHADFSGLDIDGLDLSGAQCHWADFSRAHFQSLYYDDNTRFYEAGFTSDQLVRLNFEQTTPRTIILMDGASA